jgi:hypothetical protein
MAGTVIEVFHFVYANGFEGAHLAAEFAVFSSGDCDWLDGFIFIAFFGFVNNTLGLEEVVVVNR